MLVLGALAFALAGCGGGGGGDGGVTDPPPGTPPSGLSYPGPVLAQTGVALATMMPTISGSPTSYSVAPALPPGVTLDTASGAIAGTPTQGAAEHIYTVSARNSAGTVTYGLVLAVREGPEGDVMDVSGSLPSIQVSSLEPIAGQPVEVSIDVPGATRIVLDVAGPGCGSLASQSVAGSMLRQSADAGIEGSCALEAEYTTPTGTIVDTLKYTVHPAVLPAAAGGIRFTGGDYFPRQPPDYLPSATLVASNATTTQSFINGGAGSIRVSANDMSQVTRAVVTLAGFPGHFVAPARVADGYVWIDLTTSPDLMRAPAGASRAQALWQPGEAPLAKGALQRDVGSQAIGETMTIAASIRLMDRGGAVSAPTTTALNFQSVGSGPIQVSLSFAAPVDLDLHVIAPDGSEVYYGSPRNRTGGHLDLDSNAGCRIDNVDNENIVWDNAATPEGGRYVVRVAYFSACRVSAAVPYTVRITNCGVTNSYSGVATAAQVDSGGAGSGREIATFEYTPCAGYSVSGTAMYDDYAPGVRGLAATATQKPIRHATVEVRGISNDAALASGKTDEVGNFSVNFPMTTPGRYYVAVIARQDDEQFKQVVVNSAGSPHVVKSAEIDGATLREATAVAVRATRADALAGPFNVFDIGIDGIKLARARASSALPIITWKWTRGVQACGPITTPVSCYRDSTKTIAVDATAKNGDEFDDSVLAHEFGHFVMKELSRVDSPGGSHRWIDRSHPRLAWSEGAATFIGQTIVGHSVYVDTRQPGTWGRSIETPEGEVLSGTDDGTSSGRISEARVSAVLWDLADSGRDRARVNNVNYTDVLSSVQSAFQTLKEVKGKQHDRGFAGPDLVDFLDEWICAGRSTWDASAGDNFRGLVTVLNGFPYMEQARPPNCG
jgi:hypothetical protein